MNDDCGYAHQDLTRRILNAAIEVHRHLGPGLLESTYRACFAAEIESAGLAVENEVPIAIDYKGLLLDSAYRADLIVEHTVLVELKAVEQLVPLHQAQILTYLRHCGLKVGLLLNFNVSRLKLGVRRFVL